MVIIDSPPLNPVADAQVLLDNPAIDGAVVVARVDRTTREDVRHARAILDRHRVQPVGIVVTGVREASRYGYSSYESPTLRSEIKIKVPDRQGWAPQRVEDRGRIHQRRRHGAVKARRGLEAETGRDARPAQGRSQVPRRLGQARGGSREPELPGIGRARWRRQANARQASRGFLAEAGGGARRVYAGLEAHPTRFTGKAADRRARQRTTPRASQPRRARQRTTPRASQPRRTRQRTTPRASQPRRTRQRTTPRASQPTAVRAG